MRKPFSFLIISMVLLFAVSCQRAANNTNRAANETEVKKFLTDFAAAMSKNDVTVLDKMWADDFTFVSHDGEILPKAQLLELLKSGTEKFESLTFDDVSIRTYGDTAIITANSTQKAKLEGKDHSGTARVSSVLVKNREGWRMVLAQLAELKPATKAAADNAGTKQPA